MSDLTTDALAGQRPRRSDTQHADAARLRDDRHQGRRLAVYLRIHCAPPSSVPSSVPSRIRACDLLLRSNPAADAVAICNDAGQVGGSAHCCSPSYLVIANRDSGGTIAAGDAIWIASKV